MDIKETRRKESRIMGGALLAGIAVGLLLNSWQGFTKSSLHGLLPLWLLLGGMILINSGITKPQKNDDVRRNKIIVMIGFWVLLAGVVTWQLLMKK
jgi:uncharacterized membrane protein YbjE (DUF340 family)